MTSTASTEQSDHLLAAAVDRVEALSGTLATESVTRMDETLPWFRALPANQRSWVTLVAQAGIASYVAWMRLPDQRLRLTEEVFGAAPRDLARAMSLRQTVELIEVVISIAEQRVPQLADPGMETALRTSVLRFAREIAFAAARVYAAAAERRGLWDARLEALVIDGLVRGGAAEEASPVSQAVALGWKTTGPVTVVVGSAGSTDPTEVMEGVHRFARRRGLDALAGVHGGRLVVVLGGETDPMDAARGLADDFADGPIVVGPRGADLGSATAVTQTALRGLAAARAWPSAPRPISSDDLLPERALAGDAEARADLISTIYRPLAASGDTLLDTVTAFLDSGGGLESTARALFVHPNTVRYRLRRVGEVCGQSPTTPRGAFALRLALTFGRLAEVARDTPPDSAL
ncbi:MAG: transcriptional regulator, CdaR family [Pseudonocardiales bacterium]|nr:transcriptional regulator, CdaR family [Pseudonocardiales bacterium]